MATFASPGHPRGAKGCSNSLPTAPHPRPCNTGVPNPKHKLSGRRTESHTTSSGLGPSCVCEMLVHVRIADSASDQVKPFGCSGAGSVIALETVKTVSALHMYL